ncbi:serine/threonine-protein kinase [Chondromyces apiculatus]|uniref:Serine/threonine protein kinase n=1 Tax=Chondromyces apiculatus DSM 436 TaxID=1192034 RepID=A0A017TBE2_9BACT|nr:protein kinase [Chondromyces apiculatus]EYF06247.1 serine/threonine protein kinase [Chondromyces apiculatus DSM 436]
MPAIAMAELKPTDKSDEAALRRTHALIGRVISQRYRIDEVIAMGGMGAVYRGEHVRMRKRVAIKILHPDTEGLPELVKRFEREAVAGAHIQHPNVATATDFGETEDGLFYLVAEYVRGITLHDLIRRGPLAPARAAHIARQLAAALGAAHAMDIVHRDLKPRNVMVVEAQSDLVKLIDWGFAKVRMERLSAVAAELLHTEQPSTIERLTGAGVVFGTMAYLAPEAAFGMEAVDARSDLFALGIILYEMLAGCHPFTADDPVQLFTRMSTLQAPPIAERAPGTQVPVALEAVARRLIQKLPDARFSSAEALLEALDEACEEASLSLPRPVSSSTRPPPGSAAKASVPPPPAVPEIAADSGTTAPSALSPSQRVTSSGLRSSEEPGAPEGAASKPASSDLDGRVSAERVSAERVSAERVSAERVSAEPNPIERVSAERVSAEPVSDQPMSAERTSAEPVSSGEPSPRAGASPEGVRTSESSSAAAPKAEAEAEAPSQDAGGKRQVIAERTPPPSEPPSSEPPPPSEPFSSRPALTPDLDAPRAAGAGGGKGSAGAAKKPGDARRKPQGNLAALVFGGAILGIFCVWVVTRGDDADRPPSRTEALSEKLKPRQKSLENMRIVTPSARALGSARPPSPEAASSTSAAASATPAAPAGAPDPAVREALQEAVKKRSWDEAADMLLDLAKRDPGALDSAVMADAARVIAVAVAAPPGTNPRAEPVFEALARSFGTGGPDVLYRLIETRGRSGPALRAAEKLRSPEVAAVASPAVRTAFALRDVPCNEKLDLLDRAVAEGDARTLLVMETMVRACFTQSQTVDDAIQRLKDRLKAK